MIHVTVCNKFGFMVAGASLNYMAQVAKFLEDYPAPSYTYVLS